MTRSSTPLPLSGVSETDDADEAASKEETPNISSANRDNTTDVIAASEAGNDTAISGEREASAASPPFDAHERRRVPLASHGRQQSAFHKLAGSSSSKRLGGVWGSYKPCPNHKIAKVYGQMNYDESNQFDIAGMLRRQTFQTPAGCRWRSPRVVTCDTGNYVGLETQRGTVVYRSASATQPHQGRVQGQETQCRTAFKEADAVRKRRINSQTTKSEPSLSRTVRRRDEESQAHRTGKHHLRTKSATICSKTSLHQVLVEPTRDSYSPSDRTAKPEPIDFKDFAEKLVEQVAYTVWKRIDADEKSALGQGQLPPAKTKTARDPDDDMRNEVMTSMNSDSLNTGGSSPPNLALDKRFTNNCSGDWCTDNRNGGANWRMSAVDDVRYRDEQTSGMDLDRFDFTGHRNGSEQRHVRGQHHRCCRTNSRQRHQPVGYEPIERGTFAAPQSKNDYSRRSRSSSVRDGNWIIGSDLGGRANSSLVSAASGGGEKTSRRIATSDLKFLATELMQTLYDDVRTKVDKALSNDYVSNSARKDELQTKADKAVREQVLLVVVDQIVWMMSSAK